MLYRIFAGRLPFEGANPAELAMRAGNRSRPTWDFSDAFAAEIVRCIHGMFAKDPFRRPQSPRELIEQLIRLEIESFEKRRDSKRWTVRC